MNEPLVIAVLEGSAREKRESMKAAQFVAELGRSFPDVEVILVDPRELTFPNDGNDTEGKDPRYGEIVAQADGFFIVTPEYNHSFPGSLKRMLDSEYEAYYRKPVALAGVSNGAWGGTRAVEALLPVLRTLGLVTTSYNGYFPRVQELFDEHGALHEEYRERYQKNFRGEWEDLLWFARALKAARTTV